MKKQFFISVFLCFLTACGTYDAGHAGDALCMELTSTDYDIISQAIEHFLGSPRDSSGRIDSSISKRDYYKLLITADSTILDRGSFRGYPNITYNFVDSTGNYLNNQRYKIDCSKIFTMNIHSLTAQEKNEIYGLGYDKFYEKFPEAYGSIFFSRPSYYENKERAVIYIEFFKEVLWASAAYMIFLFKNGKWEFLRKDEVWVS